MRHRPSQGPNFIPSYKQHACCDTQEVIHECQCHGKHVNRDAPEAKSTGLAQKPYLAKGGWHVVVHAIRANHLSGGGGEAVARFRLQIGQQAIVSSARYFFVGAPAV